MAESNWKRAQRRICRQWGAESAWRGEAGADDKNATAPVSLEVKYSKRRVPLGAWILQAVTQGKTDGRPWVLTVVGHNDKDPLAVVSHEWLVNLAIQAGLMPLWLTPAQWERVEANIDRGAECWEWTGYRDTSGYGRIEFNNKRWAAHRVVYMVMKEEAIPAGLQLDHLCRNRGCVNPEHLEPVTRSENVLRGDLAQRRKTHCPQGHEYDAANTYVYRGRRSCRACRRERAAGILVPSQEEDSAPATGRHRVPLHVPVPGPSASQLARAAAVARTSDVHPRP